MTPSSRLRTVGLPVDLCTSGAGGRFLPHQTAARGFLVRDDNADGTSFWHLPTARAGRTIKSDSRRHPQATRRQRGRAVSRGLPIRDRWPASVTASQRLTREDRHFTALTGVRLPCARRT